MRGSAKNSNCRNLRKPALLMMIICVLGLQAAFAQNSGSSDSSIIGVGEQTAFVTIDGVHLFPLRGVAAFPAKQRAAAVRGRIIAYAEDESLSVDDLQIEIQPDFDIIKGRQVEIVRIFEVDAELEHVKRELLSGVYLDKIKIAVSKFRHDRSAGVLWQNGAYALLVTAVTALLLWGSIRLFRWLDGWATRNVQRDINKLASKAHHLISGAQVWRIFAGLMRVLRVLTLIVLVYSLFNTVLGLFPWTRPLALTLFDLVLNPVESMSLGLLEAVPDLAFLLVLFLVVRFFLKILRLFFKRVENGYIRLENFDQDWSMPTYKILRLLVVAFAVVVAYPYIPGSDSSAFKGISVFLGIIFSLGSTSFIAGMIAGLTMTYRGAFKEGDRVTIGDITGTVLEIRLMVTRLRTAKNEIVVIPNSNILNTNVINYSPMAREKQLILHTVVGIGYDTPWRQVEAMLLTAAGRTEGLLSEPEAFVFQSQLGDFAVNYELNAYCGNEKMIPLLYSRLHANIQDVFNEYGVQIMSPAYEADPADVKTVPEDKWYMAPAKPPQEPDRK